MDSNETMKVTTLARIVRDGLFGQPLRQTYWKSRALAAEVGRLFESRNRDFRRQVFRHPWRYLGAAPRPQTGGIAQALRCAVQWVLHAQNATPDDGVPVGYFPCGETAEGWLPSYPETTGYIITSLLAYSDSHGDESARAAALKMARWEIAVQMPSGAVQGGPVCAPARQTAAAFNTGMVLDGWCSAFQATGDREFLQAGRRAADFLVADVDERGYFRTNGAFVTAGEIKTYTCLCAWALYRFGECFGGQVYKDAAVRVIEAALLQQAANGWIAHNCLTWSEAPLTHTIGYALQGILEVGALSRRTDFVDAARRGVDPLVARMHPDGYLPGRFYSDWEPAVLWSCLTGSAQIAIVCYRLAELTGAAGYREAGDRLVDWLKGLQDRDTGNPALAGAIPGSFPVFGGYMRAGYPNWATKYFVDALMLQERLAAPA